MVGFVPDGLELTSLELGHLVGANERREHELEHGVLAEGMRDDALRRTAARACSWS